MSAPVVVELPDDQDETPEPRVIQPPNYWTSERLAERYGGESDYFVNQPKIGARSGETVPKAVSRATLVAPLKSKEMAKWRKDDPRPTPITFYDGRIDQQRASLSTAVKGLGYGGAK